MDADCFARMHQATFWINHEIAHAVLYELGYNVLDEGAANCIAAAVTGIMDPYELEAFDPTTEAYAKYKAWAEAAIADGYLIPTDDCVTTWRSRMVRAGIL